jgi:hypothetical protein
MILAGSMSAQSFDAAHENTGSILGAVVDTSDDPIPGATVVLQEGSGDRLTAVTKEDGTFAFQQAKPGTTYQISVAAQGFADWTSSVSVEAGQQKTVTDIKLRILAVERAVTVSYSSKEVATQQLKAEEQQRVLRFIPNLYVTYEPHPEPLTSKMKFHLAYKSLTSPFFFGRTAAWAGVQQARDDPSEWHQGAKGYSKRLGAGFADAVTGDLISNAILPSLLHQDPRYYQLGKGGFLHRAGYSISRIFITRSDSGHNQFNISEIAGSAISAGISNAYHPAGDRTVTNTMSVWWTQIGWDTVATVVKEFWPDIRRRVHRKKVEAQTPASEQPTALKSR